MTRILGRVPLTLRRSAAGAWSGGYFTPGESTDTPFTGAMQPAPDRVLQLLPEGERQRDVQVIYTDTLLIPGNKEAGTLADLVVDGDGIVYEVQRVKNWTKGTRLPHYECIVVAVQEVDPDELPEEEEEEG